MIDLIKIVEQSMLYDFYGELLNEHQKRIYEDVVFNDLSPSEIAREEGISRQGVHDLIKRCDKILRDYEEKLHLVEKFNKTKNDVTDIREKLTDFSSVWFSGNIVRETGSINAGGFAKDTYLLVQEMIQKTDEILGEI